MQALRYTKKELLKERTCISEIHICFYCFKTMHSEDYHNNIDHDKRYFG